MMPPAMAMRNFQNQQILDNHTINRGMNASWELWHLVGVFLHKGFDLVACIRVIVRFGLADVADAQIGDIFSAERDPGSLDSGIGKNRKEDLASSSDKYDIACPEKLTLQRYIGSPVFEMDAGDVYTGACPGITRIIEHCLQPRGEIGSGIRAAGYIG